MHYTLSDLIADIVQNSVEAKSSQITLELDETQTGLTVYIQDNGIGMSKETLEKVQNPFYTDGIKHPNRKIGMGIPFLIQTVTQTDGDYKITSELGNGTSVYVFFNLTNMDTPPLGDVSNLFRQILTFTGNFDMKIIRKKTTDTFQLAYELNKSEILKALGGLESVSELSLLGDFLKSQEEKQ